MLVINNVTKLERVDSDIGFISQCLKEGIIPKGFVCKWKPQGLEMEYRDKIGLVLKDTSRRIMGITLDGLKSKKSRLEELVIKGIEETARSQDTWQNVKWMEKLDKEQMKTREDARIRKERKLKELRNNELKMNFEKADEMIGGSKIKEVRMHMGEKGKRGQLLCVVLVSVETQRRRRKRRRMKRRRRK